MGEQGENQELAVSTGFCSVLRPNEGNPKHAEDTADQSGARPTELLPWEHLRPRLLSTRLLPTSSMDLKRIIARFVLDSVTPEDPSPTLRKRSPTSTAILENLVTCNEPREEEKRSHRKATRGHLPQPSCTNTCSYLTRHISSLLGLPRRSPYAAKHGEAAGLKINLLHSFAAMPAPSGAEKQTPAVTPS